MDELFRFHALRAPEAPSDAGISLDTGSDHQSVLAMMRGTDRAQRVVRACADFLSSHREELWQLLNGNEADQFRDLAATIHALRIQRPIPSDDAVDERLREVVRARFRATPREVVDRAIASGARALVHDALISLRIVDPQPAQLLTLVGGDDPHGFARALVERARMLYLLDKIDQPAP